MTLCSVQLIFFILRHTLSISKASNLVMSSFLIVLIIFCTVSLQGHTSNQCVHHSFLEASLESWMGREILLYLIMYRKYVRKWLLLKRNRIICPEVAVNGQFFAWKIEFF